MATIEPVHAKPADREGIGDGTGVGAGGPTATLVAAFHGGGTMAVPPIGCQVGNVNWTSAGGTPTALSDMRIAGLEPSASIVHHPGEFPLARAKRIRPSGVQVADDEAPSVVRRRGSVPSGRMV